MSINSHFIIFSKPFIDAAKNVFETMVYTKIEPQKPSLKEDHLSRGDVSAIISVSGIKESEPPIENKIYEAILVVSFPYETYFKAAEAMLGEKYDSYVPDIHDMGGEIANIIMGNAKRDLKLLGYSSNYEIPKMLVGMSQLITYPKDTSIVIIPIKSDHGTFFLELCYFEK